MLDHHPTDTCGLCGADHDGQCPDTARPAPHIDTRPRADYRLPSGEIVRVIRDHGDVLADQITYQLSGDEIVVATLVAAEIPAPLRCWDPELVEHLAVWAAEHERDDIETLCDGVLAGDVAEDVLLSMVRDEAALAEAIERGRNLGWRTRS